MARRRSSRSRSNSKFGRLVPGGLLIVALALLAKGAWMAFGGGGTSEAAGVSAGSVASTGANSPGTPTGPSGGGVSPGAVTLDAEAPAATSSASATALCSGCDLVIITVCSLRRDHVGIYGEHPGLTPAIDSIAKDGFYFSRAYAASNFTLAGLTALLTGKFGSSTGVTGWDKGLTKDIPTLPEVLGYYGYRTAAFTIDAPSGFRPDYGLDRGFQRMEIVEPPRDTPDGRGRGGEPGPGGASADQVVAWLETTPTDRPVFAMFHSRSAHFPFVTDEPEVGADPTGILQMLWDAGNSAAKATNQAMPGMAGGTSQQGVVQIQGPDPLQVRVSEVGQPAVDAWKAAYAASVSRMDIDVDRVLKAIEKRGNSKKTIVLLVADHGESLYDHGELLHGDAYFDSVVNVPLLMHVPGLSGKKEAIPALVSHTDLMPTVLELLGAVPPAEIDGASIVPLLQGKSDAIRKISLIEGGVARQAEGVPRGAVISLPWTLLRQERGCGGSPGSDPPRKPGEPATCLFDVSKNPEQSVNVARANAAVVTDLLASWDAFRAANAAAGASLSLDPKMVEQLHKTGYDFRVP